MGIELLIETKRFAIILFDNVPDYETYNNIFDSTILSSIKRDMKFIYEKSFIFAYNKQTQILKPFKDRTGQFKPITINLLNDDDTISEEFIMKNVDIIDLNNLIYIKNKEFSPKFKLLYGKYFV